MSHCTLRGPPSRDAKEQKVTFQLSVSLLDSNSNSSLVQVRFIPRKLGYNNGERQGKEDEGSWVVFVDFVYNMKREQGRVRLC